MRRREFLVASGQAAFAFSARARGYKPLSSDPVPPRSEETVEQRVSAVVQAYDSQGNHRTATDVDRLSAEWLAMEVRKLGVQPSLEPFTLDRVDPQTCYLRIGEQRVDGVPLFDAGFTDSQGVRGSLGPIGSSAEIGLLEIGPFKLEAPRAEHEGPISLARRGTHKGLVIITRGRRPGLFLSNALAFRNPSGPPMLQVSNTESEWLIQQSRAGVGATLVAHVTRTRARAFNVTARIPGRNSNLPPLVFMAPRSAWWQCLTEQGCRLAVWLETIRSLALGYRPARDCFFVALSGHELGVLGMDGFLKSRQDLIRRAHAWIFFGSCIGTAHQPNRKASGEYLSRDSQGFAGEESQIRLTEKTKSGAVSLCSDRPYKNPSPGIILPTHRGYAGMKIALVLWAFFLLAAVPTSQDKKSDEDVLTEGDLAMSELTDAMFLHTTSPQTYVPVKAKVKEKVSEPGMIIFKNGRLKTDWTTGQHAHYLAENLRLEIYELAAQKSEGLDAMAISHGKGIWPKVKDIFCREYPDARYFDLAWREQYCEEK